VVLYYTATGLNFAITNGGLHYWVPNPVLHKIQHLYSVELYSVVGTQGYVPMTRAILSAQCLHAGEIIE